MLHGWMILAAALGQTTQPATPQAAPARVITVAETPSRAPVTTVAGVPIGAPAMTVAQADLPREVPVTGERPAPRQQVRSAPTTQPAAASLSAMGPDFANGIPALSGEPIEIHATRTGEIVITANEQDMKILSAIIALMDRERGKRTTRTFQLESAQATNVAGVITGFWNEYKKSPEGRVRPEDTLTIIPDGRSNLLMVATLEEHMEVVAGMIKALDVFPTGPGGLIQFTTIQLEHIQAPEAEQKIKQMLATVAKQRGIPGELANIIPDVRTNTLLISASERDLEQIQILVDLIDVEPTEEAGGVVKVAFVLLKKAVARDLASALSEMLSTESDAAKMMEEQIRRMQIYLVDEGRELPPVNLEKPIKIFAEEGTNAIVIASVEANLEPLLEIVELLDNQPVADDMLIKIYPLENADAATLRGSLQEIFDKGGSLPNIPGKNVDGRTPPGVTAALVYEISLVADERTNTLIVSGRPEQLMLVEQIVQAVDGDESAHKFPVRMIALEHADVQRVKQVAQEVADHRQELTDEIGGTAAKREKILLIEDVWTNSLIVVANEENFEDIEALARKIDGAEPDWLGDIRIISLDKELAATDLADKIEDLWERRAELRREGGLREDKPVIVTDSRSNSLIIASNKEDYEAIVQLIEQVGTLPLSPMLDIYRVRLEHNSAGKVGDLVQKLFDERLRNSIASGEEEKPSDRVFLLEDPLTNTVMVVSSEANYQEIVGLINQLDVVPVVDGVFKTYYVKNIDVTKAKGIVDDLFDGLVRPGAVDEKELPEYLTKVTVVADVRSSALIVSASPENYAVVTAILDEIDRVDVPIFQGDARFFDIEHADAVNVADVLTELLDGLRDTLPGDESDQLEYNIIPETRNNRLIIVGTRYAMQRVEEWIDKLDVEPGLPSSTVEVYTLKDGSASQLQEVMTELFDERADRDEERTPIHIIAADSSNSLVVTASQDDHMMVKELLTMLDKKSSIAAQVAIIQLEKAKAEQLADTLADLLDQQSSDYEIKFSVTPELRTNSLVIWAPPDMMDNIREVVEKLDNNRVKTEMALRVLKLYNAEAEEMAELLDGFFESAGVGNSDESKQMIIKFIDGIDSETGEAVMRSLVHQDVTIAPDPNTNALLIIAPEANIDMMEMLVKMLDNIEPVIVNVQTFALHQADAGEMQTVLEDLFEQTSEEGASRQFTIGEGGAAMGGGSAGIELAFSVDERTNSLIAAGTPTYLRMVERLIYDLDYQDIDERKPKVFRLKNRPAEDVADVLQAFFDEERDLYEDEEAGSRRRQRQVNIQTLDTEDEEGESNILLMSYSPRIESEVFQMINELDRPIPQVMIQVLMAEVTLTDSFELGMEFAAQDLLFSEKAVINPNTGQPQGGDFDYVFGTDIGAAGTGGLGGISFTMGGEDFSFLFHALQGEGRVELLSRPSIMVQDGKEANIAIGDRVPVVSAINVGAIGNVTPQVNYEEVAIELTVLPIINPDGYVSMKIQPKIQALSQSSVSISSGVTLPIITTREADTTVTVKDGETIIIGGLITSRENESENKVPILGDTPLIGPLFRSTAKSTTKTELLIVLTPTVVRVAEDAATLSAEMRDATGIMDRVRHSPLMQRLQVPPEGSTFGPADPVVPSRGSDRFDEQGPTIDPNVGEELGPDVEEYGPAAETIRVEPAEPAIAFRPE